MKSPATSAARNSLGLASAALLTIGVWSAGCASKPPPKTGQVITRFTDPKSADVIDVPANGKYGCYREGMPDPIQVATVTKGQKIGFEVLSPADDRGYITTQLYAIAGDRRFLLPLGDNYAWKREK